MLSRETVDQIQAFLDAAQWSQREIARRLGVSRGTVNAVANGHRTQRAARHEDDYAFLFEGPAVRCSGCGGKVYAPCLLCHIRDLKEIDKQSGCAAA